MIDLEGPTLLYEKHIASELSTDVISLQFATCSLHGFEKNILAVATNDSSILALESDSGKALSSGNIHPKKPSRALLMHIIGIRMQSLSTVLTNMTFKTRLHYCPCLQFILILPISPYQFTVI